jgi:hypothetical protein
MPYRKTRKTKEQLTRMQAARDRTRMGGPAPDYLSQLPEMRRRIVIEDWDFGHRVHVLECHRTNRRDCYRVTVDGKPWKDRIGWSKILEGLRKSLPRVGAN